MMWKDSYRLGVDLIDTQHIELFRMTEDLIHAIDSPEAEEASRQALSFLKDYVVEHFRDEEAYQASIHYRGLAAHQAEHRQFTQVVLNYEKRLQETRFDPAIMRDLAGTVTAWLIYHVVDTDQKIVSGETGERPGRRFKRCADLFADSALEVMGLMSGLDFSAVRPQASTCQAQGDVFVEIQLVGGIPGRIILGFTRELALNLVRAMTMMDLTEVDELVQSALFELTNIACGNAASALAQQGVPCDIRPPKLSAQVSHGGGISGMVADTPAGRLEVVTLLDDPNQQILPA